MGCKYLHVDVLVLWCETARALPTVARPLTSGCDHDVLRAPRLAQVKYVRRDKPIA
jgi:hypothetical protein